MFIIKRGDYTTPRGQERMRFAERRILYAGALPHVPYASMIWYTTSSHGIIERTNEYLQIFYVCSGRLRYAVPHEEKDIEVRTGGLFVVNPGVELREPFREAGTRVFRMCVADAKLEAKHLHVACNDERNRRSQREYVYIDDGTIPHIALIGRLTYTGLGFEPKLRKGQSVYHAYLVLDGNGIAKVGHYSPESLNQDDFVFVPPGVSHSIKTLQATKSTIRVLHIDIEG